MWQMWEFVCEISGADAKCEYLLYEMDDIDPKSRRLFWNCFEKSDKIWDFVFKNEHIIDKKSEYLLFEMSGNGIDEKCELLPLR